MKILMVHNYYQHSGGEDQSFLAEAKLLSSQNHSVHRFNVHNNQIENMSLPSLAFSTIWSNRYYKKLRRFLKIERPDIVHFHNIFPLISPSAYYAAKAEAIPIVQTLHNYRLLCPNALLFRNNLICEDCTGRLIPWPSFVHSCYRNVRTATAVTATMLSFHNLLHTYNRVVDTYIVLTDFARQKFIQHGIAENKIIVKPNFAVFDPQIGSGSSNYAIFVGRLSPEKGLKILITAWQLIGDKIPLKILGDGPLASDIERISKHNDEIEWLGYQPRKVVTELMKNATVLIFPSIWYEGLPMTIVEAYSVGLPVIASNLGAMSSIVEHAHTGLHFRPGDPEDLSNQVQWIIDHPKEHKRMRLEARAYYEANYTAERNIKMLINIYESTLSKTH